MKFVCKKAVFLLFFFFIFSFNSLFGQDWFVCLGSFRIKQNAQNRAAELSRHDISCFVYETETDGQFLYRVLLNEKHTDRKEARSVRDKYSNNPTIKELGITGLWICAVEEDLPEEAPQVEEPPLVVLQENKTETIPVSKDKPYSVLVRSYKEELAAENTKDRLVEEDIDAYVLGKYDDTSLFTFDVHAGAFEEEEETEALIERLEELGIEDLEVSDFNEISDSVEKYDEMVKTQAVVYDAGEETIPSVIPVIVQNCIREFPINKNFQIEEITIVDFDNIDDGTFSSIQESFSIFETDISSAHAVSFTHYRDELFGKDVLVFIAQGDKGQFDNSEYEGEKEILYDYKIRGGILKSKVQEFDNGIYLFGTTDDGITRIEMLAADFTMEDFNTFMNNSYSDSSMLIYPQLRKTLFILPDNNVTQRDFQVFNLEKIDQNYVKEKNYQDWAFGIYGHWCASAYFQQGEDTIVVSFYDLDYDYNAQKIHQMFMDSHDIWFQGDDNHEEMVHNTPGWYINTNGSKELSFANKSYIIATNTDVYSDIDLEGLHDMADDLKIW